LSSRRPTGGVLYKELGTKPQIPGNKIGKPVYLASVLNSLLSDELKINIFSSKAFFHATGGLVSHPPCCSAVKHIEMSRVIYYESRLPSAKTLIGADQSKRLGKGHFSQKQLVWNARHVTAEGLQDLK
jgi:hypothetical protein